MKATESDSNTIVDVGVVIHGDGRMLLRSARKANTCRVSRMKLDMHDTAMTHNAHGIALVSGIW